jgi:hypothetical protein
MFFGERMSELGNDKVDFQAGGFTMSAFVCDGVCMRGFVEAIDCHLDSQISDDHREVLGRPDVVSRRLNRDEIRRDVACTFQGCNKIAEVVELRLANDQHYEVRNFEDFKTCPTFN